MGKVALKLAFNKKGMSVIEIVVAAAIGSIVIGGLSVPLMSEMRNRKKIESYYWVSQVRTELVTSLRNKEIFDKAIGLPENDSMACLLPKVSGGLGISQDCRGQGGVIRKILNKEGKAIYDSGTAQSGFDKGGKFCDTFSETSEDCPFRYELGWSAICKGVGSCFNPDVRVEGKLVIASQLASSLDSRLYGFRWVMPTSEKSNVVCNTSGIGSGSGENCNLNIQTSCGSGSYLVGFQKNGSPICRELGAQACGAGKLLEGFDDSGKVVCGAVCK